MEDQIKYKFTAIGRTGSKEVFPANGNALVVSWEKGEENAYFRKELKGKMLFMGEDFHWLWIFETSQYRCDPITLVVEKKCGSDFNPFFVARLLLNNADWDPDQCTASIEAEVEDNYTCYNENKSVEQNILSIAYTNQTVKLVQGTIETLQCSSGAHGSGNEWCGSGDQADGWTIKSYYSVNNPEFPDQNTFNITYVREVITSTVPLTHPWVSIGVDRYAKPPALYGFRSYGGQYDNGYDYQVGGTIDNGRKLQEVYQGFANMACFPMRVKSRFFNWDPDPLMNVNLINPLKSTPYADLNEQGQIIPNADVFNKVTDFIRVIPGKELWLQNPGTLGGRDINGFYDANKNFVSLAPPVPGSSVAVKIADIPANVHFVRYEYYDADKKEIMLYMGTGGIAYSPFNDTNYVTGEKSKVDNLIIFQKSDVKRPNSTSNASIGLLTFDKLNKDICNMFQLKWDIDEKGDFIIEHVSYFRKGIGLNLVGRRDERLRSGKRKYSYDIDNMPRREVFQFADEKYQYGDFKGVPIVYSNSCVGQGDKEDKDWIVENIMTDVTLALNNPASDSQVISDDGFVLVACNDKNEIITEGTIMGGNYLNNYLSWAHLHKNFWRHERVFYAFSMNNVPTSAITVIPTKKQVTLDVSLCCGEDFDPENLVATELGEGSVAEASFDLYKENLTLTLLYPADEGLSTNDPPVAVPDVAETFMNLAIDIDVLANDEDDEGVVDPATLEIVYKSASGTVSVVNGKIRYKPNTGFTGQDLIIYRFKDRWQAPSNNGQVAITVHPGSPIPIAGDEAFSTGQNRPLTIGNVLSNDTGAGALSVVPETKATSAGGSVQIYASGSCVYTPPANFTGNDWFDYTLKDSNNNTDTGRVSITVFPLQQVYVKYRKLNQEQVNITQNCSGGGEEPMMQMMAIPTDETVIGNQTIYDQYINFYSDAAGTQPLDVTGYGLMLKIKETITGDGAGVFEYERSVSGTAYIVEGAISHYNYYGCPGSTYTYTYDKTNQILPSPNYTIIA